MMSMETDDIEPELSCPVIVNDDPDGTYSPDMVPIYVEPEDLRTQEPIVPLPSWDDDMERTEPSRFVPPEAPISKMMVMNPDLSLLSL